MDCLFLNQMDIKPATAPRLPIKHLKWEQLIPIIGSAREALGRFDETLKKTKPQRLKALKNKEARAFLQGKDSQQITLAEKGLDFAIQWTKEKPLNLEFLCRLHAIVKQDGPNPEEIGRLRKRQNWIGPEGRPINEAYFFPPEAKKVPGHMRALFRYLHKKEKDPLVQLAIFFAQLLIIHPFMDGNGRVARIFIPVWAWKRGLLCKPALFLNCYFERNRLQYFRKLFEVSEEGAWEGWIQYFLKGIIEQSQEF